MMICSFCDEKHFNQDWDLWHVSLESGAEFIHRHPPSIYEMDGHCPSEPDLPLDKFSPQFSSFWLLDEAGCSNGSVWYRATTHTQALTGNSSPHRKCLMTIYTFLWKEWNKMEKNPIQMAMSWGMDNYWIAFLIFSSSSHIKSVSHRKQNKKKLIKQQFGNFDLTTFHCDTFFNTHEFHFFIFLPKEKQ